MRNDEYLQYEESEEFMKEGRKMEVDKATKAEILNYVKEYFPKEAAKALVMFNSEYNDEGYDTSSKLVLVFDKDGNELVPLKGQSVRARENVPEMWDYINNWREATESDEGYSDDPIEDLVIELV